MKVDIIFLAKYSKWVSDLVPIRKATEHVRFRVDFRAVKRAIMNFFFPLSNIEMILQRVTGTLMMPLLDVFSSYNQINVKGADAYKTTFITDWGTVTYEHMLFGLPEASTTFKRPIHKS